MTLEQLHYVLEISKIGSMNKAAPNLFITQSALSLSIKKLEEELGQSIFIRNNRGIRLTPFGKLFISYISPIDIQLQQLNAVCLMAANTNQSLTLASNGHPILSKLCGLLYEAHKGDHLRIEQYDAAGDEAIDMVSNHIVELGVIRIWDCYKSLYEKLFKVKNINFFPLCTVNISIMVGEKNPLFHVTDSHVTAEMLQPYPIILERYMDTLYNNMITHLNLAHANSIFVTNSRAIVYELLENTDAFYISSNVAGQKSDTNMHLKTLILDHCETKSKFGWITHQYYNPTPMATEFINLMKDFFNVP